MLLGTLAGVQCVVLSEALRRKGRTVVGFLEHLETKRAVVVVEEVAPFWGLLGDCSYCPFDRRGA